MLDLDKANLELGQSSPQTIINWALTQANKPIVTTNFGPYEAVILHMVTQANPTITVIWVDSGYNTRATYTVAQNLIDRLSLNIDVYTPKVSAARQDAALGGIPSIDEERHAAFTEQFKLEPFSRAMQSVAPDIWFTAVRSEQTAFRRNMKVFSEGMNGVIKVAPLLYWEESQMNAYLEEHSLPNVDKYFDPTKAEAGRECGLHTKI